MEKQGGKGDGSDIGDCSDNDLNNVKSPNHMCNIQLVLPHKINYICFCTMVSVISIVVMVVMLVVISNDDLQNGFQITKEISRVSNKLESLSSKIDSHSSTTDGQRTCEKINTSYLYYAFQEENRRLKDELQKTKFRKEHQKNCFQLTKDISRLSNQLENLSTTKISDSSTTDGQQTCDKINTSYLYYAFQEENRRLKDELQKTKSRKEHQKNCFQLTKDISRLSNQLESLSTTKISDSSTTDEQQTCDKINTSYLYYAIQAENRRLKEELQETKSRKDSITCADIDNEPNQHQGRKEQSRFSCNSVSSANNVNG